MPCRTRSSTRGLWVLAAGHSSSSGDKNVSGTGQMSPERRNGPQRKTAVLTQRKKAESSAQTRTLAFQQDTSGNDVELPREAEQPRSWGAQDGHRGEGFAGVGWSLCLPPTLWLLIFKQRRLRGSQPQGVDLGGHGQPAPAFVPAPPPRRCPQVPVFGAFLQPNQKSTQ